MGITKEFTLLLNGIALSNRRKFDKKKLWIFTVILFWDYFIYLYPFICKDFTSTFWNKFI